MSSIQLVVYGVLWVALMTLAGLLLLLYRQVERVYSDSYAQRNIPLGSGVEAPPIEIIGDDGVEASFEFPPQPQLTLLAFLLPSCASCTEVARVLRDRAFPGAAFGVVLGEDKGEFEPAETFRPVWAAHPPDVMRAYGVGQPPFAYVLRGRTILAAKYVEAREDVERLYDEALARESAVAAGEAAEPVSVA